MNKLLLSVLLAGSVLWLAGCTKDNTCKPVPVDNEKAPLEAFAAASGINATRHQSGLYYEIIAPGGSARPTQLSRVFVRYKGTLMDGKVFDSQSNPGMTGFALSTLIEGWKIGIPLIGRGGRIKLLIPSALGYGCKGSGTGDDGIPANAPLYFEIDLVDFL